MRGHHTYFNRKGRYYRRKPGHHRLNEQVVMVRVHHVSYTDLTCGRAERTLYISGPRSHLARAQVPHNSINVVYSV